MPHTLTRSSHLSLIVLCLFVSLASSQVHAQETNSRPRVSVIPQPRELTSTGESFRLDRAAHITLADPRSSEDQFAAGDFIDQKNNTEGVTIKTRPLQRPGTIM